MPEKNTPGANIIKVPICAKACISIREMIRQAVFEWVREKYGFDKKDAFFRMRAFRASKDLSKKT